MEREELPGGAKSHGQRWNHSRRKKLHRGVRKGVIMSASGFMGNMGAWHDVIDLKMEKHAALPEKECQLVRPLWKTVWQYLLELIYVYPKIQQCHS